MLGGKTSSLLWLEYCEGRCSRVFLSLISQQHWGSSPLRTRLIAELLPWKAGLVEQAGMLGSWCAEFWPGMRGSSPLSDIPRHRGQWVRRWSEPLSGLETVTNRKGESTPHRGRAANSRSTCWPLRTFVPDFGWLSGSHGSFFLLSTHHGLVRTVGWHRDEDKFCSGGFVIWAFDVAQTLC